MAYVTHDGQKIDAPEGQRQPNPWDQWLEKQKQQGVNGLAWLVRGCLTWQRDGLQPPAKIKADTEEYRHEEDPLALWEVENTIKSDLAATRGGILYADYRNWAIHNGLEPMSVTAFGKRMKKRYQTDVTRGTTYLGIGLLTKEEQPNA